MSMMDQAWQQHMGMLNKPKQESEFDPAELMKLAQMFLTQGNNPITAQDPATAFLKGGGVQNPTMQQPSQYQPGQITPPSIGQGMPQPGQIPGMQQPMPIGMQGQMPPPGMQQGMPPGMLQGINPQLLQLLMGGMIQ